MPTRHAGGTANRTITQTAMCRSLLDSAVESFRLLQVAGQYMGSTAQPC
jgi:hypothetical protein